MARKRMFSLQIVDTDAFLEMPLTSQLLYFHLTMRADDEGFVGNPKKIMRMIGTQDDDLKILLAKRFILSFESGVVVIKHWLIHNTIRMDRFNETTYQNEKNLITTRENKAYTESLPTKWQPNVNQMEPQVKLSKVKLIKSKLEEETPSQKMKKFIISVNEENEEYLTLLENLKGKGVPEGLARQELKKFVSYWTELNKSGTKQKWELQKTFEVQRRLATWFGNIRGFNKQSTMAGKNYDN